VTEGEDLLWRHLRDLPAFRALLRAVEASFYARTSAVCQVSVVRDLGSDVCSPPDVRYPFCRPVLDLGCGDGHFATMAFDEPLDAGFDPWWGPLTEARRRRAYHVLSQAEGARMPYPGSAFATVVSNSVLEHIPRVQPVLAEVARVLQPGGWFYFCVPGPGFLPALSIGRALDRVGLRSLGDTYRRFFNAISRHYHCDGAEVWERRLEMVGLRLVRWWSYFPRPALTALEWGHYLGLPALVCKRLTGRWVLWPSRANLWLTERLVRPLYEASIGRDGAPGLANGDPDDRAGAYLFFVAQKEGRERTEGQS